MIKPFISFALLLIVMGFAMGMHTALFPYKKYLQSLQNGIQLTHMAPLSLSVAYDESPFNMTYPEMPNLARKNFVYEH